MGCMDMGCQCLTIISLALNFIALIYVIKQTKLAKKSFDIANESFVKDKQIRELELLHNLYPITQVEARFNRWLEDLGNIKIELEVISKNKDENALKQIAQRGLKTSKGLIDKNALGSSDDWLLQIYVTGARYYYYSMAELNNLWDDDKQKGNLHLLEPSKTIERIFDRLETSINSIVELKDYIKNAIPGVILEAPASLSDELYTLVN